METVTVPRKGALPLRFTGELIGDASSHSDGKQRWFEVEIWRTDTDKYVVHGIGVSEIDGEQDWHWAEPCDTPDDVVRALERDGDHGRYLPSTSLDALERAADADDGIADVFVESV